MPNRIIREGILTSDRIEMLDAPAEVFYRRLMSKVDDHGLYDARPSILRSSLYPLRVDRVREADITRWIAACEMAGVIALYSHGGKPLLQMLDTRWQARSEPKYPLPDGSEDKQAKALEYSCNQVKSFAHLDVGVVGDVSEGGDGGDKARKRTKSKSSPLPENFSISDRVKQWADEKGHSQLPERLEHFISYVKRNGKTYVDWDEALMGAIREDWAKLTKGKSNGYVNGKDAGRKRAIVGLTGYDADAIAGVSQRVD